MTKQSLASLRVTIILAGLWPQTKKAEGSQKTTLSLDIGINVDVHLQ